jgi:choline kinase/phosphatidylglycerophosphate synthase
VDALILAAGDGTRLSPFTKDKPKVMIEIYGIPILERSLHVLKNVGVKRALIIIGYRGDVIREYLGNEWKGMEIIYEKTDWYDDGILKSAIKGKGVIKDRFIFLCGDTIPEEESLKLALAKDGQVVISVRNLEDDSVVAEVLENGIVQNIGMRKDLEKFNRTVAGISVNDPVFFDAIEDCVKNKIFDRPDAIKWMIRKGYKVNSFEISNDTLLEVDTFEDLKKAKRVIFEKAWKQRLPNPSFYMKIINFPISLNIVKVIAKTCITPFQITVFWLSLGIISGILSFLTYLKMGALLAYLCAILDAVDGKLSRLKYQKTVQGAILDTLAGRITDSTILIGYGYGLYRLTKTVDYLLLSSIAVACILGWHYLRESYHNRAKRCLNFDKIIEKSFLFKLQHRDLMYFLFFIIALTGFYSIAIWYAITTSFVFFVYSFLSVLRFVRESEGLKPLKSPQP